MSYEYNNKSQDLDFHKGKKSFNFILPLFIIDRDIYMLIS